MVLLNFFRAKAEHAARERMSSTTIYAIEEPETSQHPHNQRLLMRALQTLAGNDQVIVTTHTPMLARALPSSALRFVNKRDDERREILVGGTDAVNGAIARSLGVLPDHSVRLFIAVEGIHDVAFLKNLATMLQKQGVEVPNLDKMELDGEIIFVPAGGADNLAYWSTRFGKLNRPEFHLFDRDAPSGKPPKHLTKANEVNKRPGCCGVITRNLEAENYIHKDAINAAIANYGYTLTLVNNFGGDDDVPTLLAAQLNAVAPSHDKWGPNRVKRWFANDVILRMDLRMLKEIDTHGEMQGWLGQIKNMLEAVPR